MAAPNHQINIILGAGGIGDAEDPVVGQSTPEAAQNLINIYRESGYNQIDTARGYPPHKPGTSEPILGATDISSWAKIDTKVLSHAGQHTPDNITASLTASLAALRVSSVHTLYLHWPDRTVPILPVLQTINTHYHSGKFLYFGISNYEAHEVDLIISLCTQHNLLKPTVYQLHYNAITRSAESVLIPTLRRHNIAINVWSPAAAGFFSKSRFRFESDTRIGEHIRKQYAKPALEKALAEIHEIADREGVSGHGIALRWLLWHSMLDGRKGDGIVIGARTEEQLKGTLEICGQGALGEEVLKLVERCWEEMRGEAPHFSPFPPKDGEVLRE